MSDKPKYETREQWLQEAVKLMVPMFKGHNYDVPEVYVSAGWPSRGALPGKKQRLGECWHKKASADGKHQIFLSPLSISVLDHRAENDKCGILPTLVHEVVHAVVGIDQKHGKLFGKCARAVGLEGKLTATHAGDDLYERCKQWVTELGPYPHAVLTPSESGVKKQGTRLIKCMCDDCQYTVRTTQKWIVKGPPICPCNNEPMTVQVPEGGEGDE